MKKIKIKLLRFSIIISYENKRNNRLVNVVSSTSERWKSIDVNDLKEIKNEVVEAYTNKRGTTDKTN